MTIPAIVERNRKAARTRAAMRAARGDVPKCGRCQTAPRTGSDGYCKSCRNAYHRRWRAMRKASRETSAGFDA